jgi:hypothetical protein
LRSVAVCQRVRHYAHAGIFLQCAYIFVMSFIRYKTIKGKQYAYRQTSVRKGKKVHSVMQYLGAVAGGAVHVVGTVVFVARDMAGLDETKRYGTPIRGTDQRANAHQEAYERELFDKDREAFNSLHRMQVARQNRGKVKAEPRETDKDRELKEQLREFQERRDKEKEPPNCPPGGPK